VLDPSKVFLFEEHSSTLPVWWAQKNGPRTAVYLDAHLDLQQTSEKSIDQLANCKTLDEIKALEAPNHLNPSTRFAYGIENFLYAAHKLQLIDRLIWVAPAHIPRNYSDSLLDYMQQMDGISFAELTSFESIGSNSLRGKLLGLDITICDYSDLGSLGIGPNYYLDVDIDYFVNVPSDQLWVEPRHVISTIIDQLGTPSLTTISRAVGSGFMPLAFRFVGDLIASQLTDNKQDLDYFQEIYWVIDHLAHGRLDEGQALCLELVQQRPDQASAMYLLGISCADSVQKNHYLTLAGETDTHYSFDLSRDAIGLLHRKKSISKQTVGALWNWLKSMTDQSDEQSKAEVAMAQVLAAHGESIIAQQLLDKQVGDYEQHDDVALAIAANQLGDAKKRDQTKSALERIAKNSKNGSAALLYLGDIEYAQKNHAAALSHYEQTHQRAPAWMLPIERIKSCYAELEMQDKLCDVELLLEQRKARLSALLNT
jgi:hypothetical protein